MTNIIEYFKRNQFALLLLLGVFFIIFGLWAYPLVDVDETRYTIMARELIGSKDWNLVFLNGVPFTEKPPLYFWLTAISIKLFGFNEFAARFPNALFALLTVIYTYFFGKKIVSEKFGFYSATILLTSFFFLMLSHVALLDMLFSGFLAMAIYTGILTSYCKQENKKYLWWTFYALMALGMLSKGLLAILIPSFIIFVYKFFTKELKDLFNPLHMIIGAIIFFLIATPWHYHMYQVYGQGFIYDYFILHHFSRFSDADTLGKTRPFLYYVPVFLVAFLPWSINFLISTFKEIKKIFAEKINIFKDFNSYSNEQKMFILAFFTFATIFGLFSLASGKLPTYILPALPFSALITAFAFVEMSKKSDKLFKGIIYFMIFAKFICIFVVFKLIYLGGMVELVEYSKVAQSENRPLITYNMPIKPSVRIHKPDDMIFIKGDNILELRKNLKDNTLVITRNSNLENSKNKASFNRMFKLKKKLKKYSLYERR